MLPRFKTFRAFHVSPLMSDLQSDNGGQFLVLHRVFMKRFEGSGVDIKVKTDECVPADGFE
jgi:hypothetical protein